MNHDGNELEQLAHEARPGYGPAFRIVFAITIVMLILYFTFSGAGGGH